MQVVLITGCGSGLGRSLARCFQDQRTFRNKASRFRVFASDISLQSIADLELEGIETLQLDVTQPDSVEQAVKHIERLAGRIDILVCNAGVIKVAPILEENVSEIQAVWNVNT